MISPRSAKSRRLGEYLVEKRKITGEQLIRAIQSQRVVGGRIGTCLLEMDVLTEDALLEALSEQLFVPAAQIDDLRTVTEQVLALLPAKVAVRCQAIPLTATKKEIRVATLNVQNLEVLDELAFCTNKRVVPLIANEVRIYEALERYYGLECPSRYGHLLDRLNRSRYMWDESAKVLLSSNGDHQILWEDPDEVFAEDTLLRSPTSRSPRAATEQLADGVTTPPDRDESNQRPETPSPDESERGERPAFENEPDRLDEISERRDFEPAPADAVQDEGRLSSNPPPTTYDRAAGRETRPSGSPPASSEVPAPESDQESTESVSKPIRPSVGQEFSINQQPAASEALTLEEVDRIFAEEPDRHTIGEIAVHFVAQTLPRCALFKIQHDKITGWLAQGTDLDLERFHNFEVTAAEPSVFHNLVCGLPVHYGPLSAVPAHEEIRLCWQTELARTCIMLPIRVRRRLICVLFGEVEENDVELDLLPYHSLAEKVGMALELCILRRKLAAK